MFLAKITKALATKAKTNKFDYTKLKSTWQNQWLGDKRESTEWEKLLSNYTSDKSFIIQEAKHFNSKNLIKKWETFLQW